VLEFFRSEVSRLALVDAAAPAG